LTGIVEILEALRGGESTLDEATVALQRARLDPGFDHTELSGTLERLVAAGDLPESAAATLLGGQRPETPVLTKLRPASREPDPRATRQSSVPHPIPGSESDDAGDWAEQVVQPARLGVGDVLRDRFVIEEAIGEGGMGLVFRARDRRREEAFDRNPYVAIKFLGDQLKSHPDALIALQREARRMQQLSHPHIASVYDFDRDGAHVYLVMELLEGDSLDRVLERNPGVGLPTDQSRQIIVQAGKALRHAHSRGVVHSDFKPANVFLTRHGEVKIIDFGIARIAKDSTQGTETTMTVFDAGRLGAYTNAYASPEQILATEDPHPKDDIYSFGLVVYEALTGKHPFGSKSAVEARFRDLKVEPVPGLNPQQNALLASALSFDRKLRLDSIAMLVQAFALNEEPIIAMRDVLRPRRTDADSADASVDRRRNWGLAVLAAVSAAGVGYYFLSHRTQRDEVSVPLAETGPTSNPATGTAPKGTAATDARQEQAAHPGVVKGKTPAVAKTAVLPGPQSPAVASNPADTRSANAAASGSPTRARAQGTTQGPDSKATIAATADPGAADTASGAAPATPDAGARSLYRWVDKQGNVQFGETPPAEYADVAVKVVDL
jgi:hypothetical protein